MSYIDVGQGDPIVFLHGNPTSSYLWRNVLPHVEGLGRCLAPDLLGMGQSGKSPNGDYRFMNHSKHLDEWLQNLEITSNLTLVIHDWGSALGFYRAHRFPAQIKGIVYMEAIVQALTWDMWPEKSRSIFQAMRSDAGEEIILNKNVFVDRILPGSILRELSQQEMDIYRKPYLEEGESRRPTLTWPREIPIEGTPPDVFQLVHSYSQWLANNSIPKLFINAEPGAILTGQQRDFCRGWNNQDEVTVQGSHFIQEDSPNEIGVAIANWYSSLK
tara:strand:+ start:1595 stop:2410 length:816 start_codon:yes stop_codon:yes gene_type:complete